jgi:aryl carrier-like protein
MVPSAVVLLDDLPLMSHGKVDRRALPAPDADAYAARDYEPPQGKIEQTLAAIWAELLGVERVGRHDNFFELGGHSMLAIQLIERMRHHGLQVDVRALFNAPTLAGLAAAASHSNVGVEVPSNLIPEDCARITPEMLPLISLSQTEIDRIAASVPGGMANIQDIYPLAPLQGGGAVPSFDCGGRRCLPDVHIAGIQWPGAAGRFCHGSAGGGRPPRYLAHGGGVGGAL